MNDKTSMTHPFRIAKGLDLNLLNIFEAVFTSCSVTRAAMELNIAPSSVSQEMNKLRLYFSDPLFVREGKGLVPTTTAINIHEVICNNYYELLAQIKTLSSEGTNNRLVVHTTPYLAMQTLPVVSNVVSEIIPDCKIIHASHNNTMESVSDALTFRKADIIFDFNSNHNLSIVSHQVSSEKIAFFCRSNHPRFLDSNQLSIKQIQEEKSIVTDTDYLDITISRKHIEEIVGCRKISMTSPSFISIAGVVESSDSLCILPVKFYEKFKSSFDIKMLDTEFELPTIPVYMIYNKSSLQHPKLVSIINEIKRRFNHCEK